MIDVTAAIGRLTRPPPPLTLPHLRVGALGQRAVAPTSQLCRRKEESRQSMSQMKFYVQSLTEVAAFSVSDEINTIAVQKSASSSLIVLAGIKIISDNQPFLCKSSVDF